jgi:hypothetical protein
MMACQLSGEQGRFLDIGTRLFQVGRSIVAQCPGSDCFAAWHSST